jgi:hypothetical protein
MQFVLAVITMTIRTAMMAKDSRHLVLTVAATAVVVLAMMIKTPNTTANAPISVEIS